MNAPQQPPKANRTAPPRSTWPSWSPRPIPAAAITQGLARAVLLGVALVWSLFQLWIASPLPFALGFGVFNDTESRSLHLGFALLLAFWRTRRSASRRATASRWPTGCWELIAAFCGSYLFWFYGALATRPGAPILQDIVVAIVGLVLLLEAARRALGLPMVILAVVFIAYIFAGPYMPDMIAHKGASLGKGMSHLWLTTEGVFGVALGVSSGFIFLFVLFGALLETAGAGNYFIQSAISHAGPPARRPGQGGGGGFGQHGADLRLVDRQRGDHRHLHHPADETRGLPARQGRRGGGGRLGGRADHAARDGRGRVPDGRVRGHPLHPGAQARRCCRR